MAIKRKIKKSAKLTISALAVLLLIALVWGIAKPKKDAGTDANNTISDNTQTSENDTNTDNAGNTADNNSKESDNENSEPQAQLIESEGDIEIIIPDDQESDGF